MDLLNLTTDSLFLLLYFKIASESYHSSILSLVRALRESGRRIGYELKKMSRDHFWRSISRDTNVEVSALSLHWKVNHLGHAN